MSDDTIIGAREKILSTQRPLAERLRIMTQAASEMSQNAIDLIVIEHHIQEEIDVRVARVAQGAMRNAKFGLSNYFTFKDKPVARDIDFDLDVLRLIHIGMTNKLELGGVVVKNLEGPIIIYTKRPSDDWDYWGEVDYLETRFKVSWDNTFNK